QISQNVEQISSVVAANSATAEESAAASGELSTQAGILRELTRHFNLRNMKENLASATAPAPTSAVDSTFSTSFALSGDKY
ncbi:MAG: methyl-accepting chemotaxis protein, partial [Oscillospiraceae bacterium]|nr:methyl-accepting chemotaxis protein [Oscillospiraceae bacterium]